MTDNMTLRTDTDVERTDTERDIQVAPRMEAGIATPAEAPIPVGVEGVARKVESPMEGSQNGDNSIVNQLANVATRTSKSQVSLTREDRIDPRDANVWNTLFWEARGNTSAVFQ